MALRKGQIVNRVELEEHIYGHLARLCVNYQLPIAEVIRATLGALTTLTRDVQNEQEKVSDKERKRRTR